MSGLIPLVVVVVIVVLFARSCFQRLEPGDDSEPEDPEQGLGAVIDEDEGDGEDEELLRPEVDPEQLDVMLEPREPECPAEDGEERHLQWTEPPPMCIDEGADYVAILHTTAGEIEIELDTDNAPETVNNFVFLARWGFYDDTYFDAVFPDASIQGGLPLGPDGDVTDPGYTVEGELPSEDDDSLYPRYSVVMSNDGAETGAVRSAFSIRMAGEDAELETLYSRLGQISGRDSWRVVDAIEATGRERPGSDGTPSEITIINEVSVTEN